MIKKWLIAATLAAGMATGASAATVVNLAGGPSEGSSLTLATGLAGINVTVTPTNSNVANDTVTRDGNGLGVAGSSTLGPCPFCITLTDPDTGLDTLTGYEALTFTFSEAVKLGSLGFSLFDASDDYTITVNGVSTASDENPFSFGWEEATSFKVGVIFGDDKTVFPSVIDSFRVSELTIAAVPLPAAGWLMLAGLGGLAATRRRRKAA